MGLAGSGVVLIIKKGFLCYLGYGAVYVFGPT